MTYQTISGRLKIMTDLKIKKACKVTMPAIGEIAKCFQAVRVSQSIYLASIYTPT